MLTILGLVTVPGHVTLVSTPITEQLWKDRMHNIYMVSSVIMTIEITG